MAEEVGFEPTVPVRAQRFSRASSSTTPASLLVEVSWPGYREKLYQTIISVVSVVGASLLLNEMMLCQSWCSGRVPAL